MTEDQEILDVMAKFAEEKKKPIQNQAAVSRCLSAKKKAGIKIDKQAVAICISESRKKKSKMTEEEYFKPIPITYQIVSLVPNTYNDKKLLRGNNG